jgi:hypothetical protein
LTPDPARACDDRTIPHRESRVRLRLIRTVAVTALVTGCCYLLWRVAATLPGTSWWLALPLLLLEVHATVTFALHLQVLWAPGTVTAPEPADEPDHSVTVLVPTYNEPAEVLLPTLAAAAALRQAREVWVLDDGARAWVRDMAASLGVVYRSRPVREHAKAGNVNAALSDVSTDLVAVLDATTCRGPTSWPTCSGTSPTPRWRWSRRLRTSTTPTRSSTCSWASTASASRTSSTGCSPRPGTPGARPSDAVPA